VVRDHVLVLATHKKLATQAFGGALFLTGFVQTWWWEKGREGGAANLPHPHGSGDSPVPLPKTVRRAKGFKEAYSTDGVARQACTVFGSSTSAGVAKTPPRPSLPFLKRLLHKSNG